MRWILPSTERIAAASRFQETAKTPVRASARSIHLGEAICVYLDATQAPNVTVDHLVSLGHTNSNANIWMAGSVLYLCPQLNYLTDYVS
jgi:hypothetical protein